MKIDDNTKSLKFKEIEYGETFRVLPAGAVYMRIEPTGEANAVALADGRVTTFATNDDVIPCNAKVVIE